LEPKLDDALDRRRQPIRGSFSIFHGAGGRPLLVLA
jgi:hypothetical protein